MFATRKVKIDADLYKRAVEAAPDAGYATARELIQHAAEKLLDDLGRRGREDQQTVEDRLRGLGYIS